MHRKDIVGLLIGAMERHSNIDLLILIVSFLQKLSIFVENKNNMASKGLIEKLSPLLDSSNADLVNVTLKLLFNLTFDTKLRNKMIKIGILPKLIKYTSDDKHINLAMKILYHLSMDDRVKVMFTQTDCVKLRLSQVKYSVSGPPHHPASYSREVCEVKAHNGTDSVQQSSKKKNKPEVTSLRSFEYKLKHWLIENSFYSYDEFLACKSD